MKRTLIAATIAALGIPVLSAAPVFASNDVHIKVDPRLGVERHHCRQPSEMRQLG